MITALILLPGCAKEEEPVPEEDLLPVVNEISFDHIQSICLGAFENIREKTEENLILSPVSVGITLTMLQDGSVKATQPKEIDEVMGMTIDDYNMVIDRKMCRQIVDRGSSALSGVCAMIRV